MQNIFSTCLAVTASVVFICFIWAIRRFFVAPPKPQLGMRLISILGMVFMVVHVGFLLAGNPSPLWFVVALVLYVVALVLFLQSFKANLKKPLTLAYSQDTPEHLVQVGPYRFVRHPFYTSYTLAWLAGVVGSGQWILLVSVAIMFYLYFRAARLEEEKFASSQLGESYREYKIRTGMFFPKLYKNW